MAWNNVICSKCGKEFRVQLYGKIKDREWKKEHWTWVCDECKSKEFEEKKEEELQEALQIKSEFGLPDLIGSEKQIKWAEAIRGKFVKELDKELSNEIDKIILIDDIKSASKIGLTLTEEDFDKLNNIFYSQDKATYWIDIRSLSLYTILANSYKENVKVKPEEIKIQKEINNELTLRPEEPVSECIATIQRVERKNVYLSVSFEKNDNFKTLVKSLGYTWDSDTRSWFKAITNFSGPFEDRETELAYHLLENGFIVRVYTYSIIENVKSGNVKKEQKNWIFEKENIFKIMYDKNNNDHWYKILKKYKCFSYSSFGFFNCKKENYETIIDFANQYNFKLSEGALKLIEEAKKEKDSQEIIKIKKIENTKETDKKVDTTKERIVNEDLLDD